MKTMLTSRGSHMTPATSKLSNNSSSSNHHHHHHHHINSNNAGSSGPVDTSHGLAAAFAAGTTIVSGGNSTTVVCKVPKFLRSLYAILQTEDPAVISWVQNQELKPNRVTAFHILDMDRFEKEILLKYFKHQKFASFQRQLNNFGFRKWTKTQSSGVCTFSHNCFPPDPNHTGVMRASIREQWRQKSTLTASSSSSSLSSVASSSPPPTRRRVGNGITKADRKSRRPENVQIPQTESFMELYKSPLNTVLAMESHRQQYAPSHQPAMKKLARPLQEANGLEAFCDDSYKQFILPPLQPHHLLSSTPRGLYSSSHEAEPTTPNLGGFPHARNVGAEFNVKPYDYQDKMSAHHHNGMDAGFNGTFIEPWTWDANMNTALELSGFPLDFWQDSAAGANNNNNNNTSTTNVSVSVGVATAASGKDGAFCHQQQDRAMPSAEEFGLETFLFAE